MSWSKDVVKTVIAAGERAGMSGDHLRTMAAIALLESGGRPSATSNVPSAGDVGHGKGLWQIDDRFWSSLPNYQRWADPVQNGMMAEVVYAKQGYGAWVAYTTHLQGGTAQGKQALSAVDSVLKESKPGSLGSFLDPFGHTDKVVGSLTAIADPVSSAWNALSGFLKMLTDPQLWIRAGYIVGGGILFLYAVSALL